MEEKSLPNPLDRTEIPAHNEDGIVASPAAISSPSPEEIVKKKKLMRLYLALILVAIPMMLVIISKIFHLGATKTSQPIIAIQPTIPPSPTPDPTAGWKEYKGDGFLFKYYPSSEIKENKGYISWLDLYQDGRTQENMYMIESSTPFSPIVKGGSFRVGQYLAKALIVDNTKEITLSNTKANYYTFNCGVDCYYGVVDFKSNETYFRLIHNLAGGGLSQGFDRILSTFSFMSENEKANEISMSEKQEIDAWIKKSDLNMYGDPKDMMYTGGTPLFNEATGETTDRYEYIVKKYPNKPWSK